MSASFWRYYFDEFGQGVALDFPLKLKTKLSFQSTHFSGNKGGPPTNGPLFPCKKVTVIINLKACSQNVIT